MKLTGAVISNNFENSIQKKEVNNNTLPKRETSTSGITNTPTSAISKLESMGIANLEKSKYYQTQISLLQKSENAVDSLVDKLYDLEDVNSQEMDELEKNSKIQEILNSVEKLTEGQEFKKNEILSDLNIGNLALDKYISSSDKENILNEAMLQAKIRKNELSLLKDKNENELTKVRLAGENLKAANSLNVDDSNIMESLESIKGNLDSEKTANLNGNISQARVMNILNS